VYPGDWRWNRITRQSHVQVSINHQMPFEGNAMELKLEPNRHFAIVEIRVGRPIKADRGTNPQQPQKTRTILGVLDTGANRTFIHNEIITSLELQCVDRTGTEHMVGVADTRLYDVWLEVHGKVFPEIRIAGQPDFPRSKIQWGNAPELLDGDYEFQALIGTDVLKTGTLTYNGTKGTFSLIFPD
jgi:hypothetical protein